MSFYLKWVGPHDDRQTWFQSITQGASRRSTRAMWVDEQRDAKAFETRDEAERQRSIWSIYGAVKHIEIVEGP